MDRLKELKIDRRERRSPEGPTLAGGWLLGLLAVLVVAAAAFAWWWHHRGRAIEVRTVRVQESAARGSGAADAEVVLDASGYVTARRRATVSSKITGKIVEVRVEEGMKIAAGQLLARLDDATAVRQLALAEAELEAARSALAETEVRLAEAALDLERSRRLVAADVASQADLDAARAAHDALAARLELGREQIYVAERRVELRRQDLADTEIRAPFAGVAVTKNAQPGEMISPVSAGGGFTRTGVCTLVDMSSLEIEVDVNEAYIQRVGDGQRITATLDAYPDWRIPGSVITTVPTADRQKATVRVRIAFDELDPRILPDMGIKVSFLSGVEAAAGAGEPSEPEPRLTIPAAALRGDGDDGVVFVLRGEDRVQQRAVRTGGRRGDRIEILSGLSAGERVVVEASAELGDGVKVVETP